MMDNELFNELIAVKLFGLKEGVDYGTIINGHEWRLDDDGELYKYEGEWEDFSEHSGPICVRCNYFYCTMCGDMEGRECIVPLKDYTSEEQMYAVINKLKEIGKSVKIEVGRINKCILTDDDMSIIVEGDDICKCVSKAIYKMFELEIEGYVHINI